MQLSMKTWMLSAVCALGLVMTGCPGEDAATTTCTSDADCNAGTELCHPTAKVCVQTCTAGADCPSSAKTCAAISSSDSRLICQCSTDALCNQDRQTADLKCDPNAKVCVPVGSTPTPSGGDVGASCSGEGQTTCQYGLYCNTSSCAEVPAPTCSNFTNMSPAFSWSRQTSTGPVIYSITQDAWGNATYCQGAGDLRARALVKAYNANGTFPTTESGLSGVFYVTVNGSQTDATKIMTNYQQLDGGKRAQFNLNFCPGASATTIQIGVYFQGGNGYCARLSAP